MTVIFWLVGTSLFSSLVSFAERTDSLIVPSPLVSTLPEAGNTWGVAENSPFATPLSEPFTAV